MSSLHFSRGRAARDDGDPEFRSKPDHLGIHDGGDEKLGTAIDRAARLIVGQDRTGPDDDIGMVRSGVPNTVKGSRDGQGVLTDPEAGGKGCFHCGNGHFSLRGPQNGTGFFGPQKRDEIFGFHGGGSTPNIRNLNRRRRDPLQNSGWTSHGVAAMMRSERARGKTATAGAVQGPPLFPSQRGRENVKF